MQKRLLSLSVAPRPSWSVHYHFVRWTHCRHAVWRSQAIGVTKKRAGRLVHHNGVEWSFFAGSERGKPVGWKEMRSCKMKVLPEMKTEKWTDSFWWHLASSRVELWRYWVRSAFSCGFCTSTTKYNHLDNTGGLTAAEPALSMLLFAYFICVVFCVLFLWCFFAYFGYVVICVLCLCFVCVCTLSMLLFAYFVYVVICLVWVYAVICLLWVYVVICVLFLLLFAFCVYIVICVLCLCCYLRPLSIFICVLCLCCYLHTLSMFLFVCLLCLLLFEHFVTSMLLFASFVYVVICVLCLYSFSYFVYVVICILSLCCYLLTLSMLLFAYFVYVVTCVLCLRCFLRTLSMLFFAYFF